jgi:GT2 family glycosyltransferase
MSARVAVIVVNWNSGQLLRRCLAALTNQTATIDSIIVVDNASSDGSIASIETHYSNVQIVPLDRNIGFAAANNHAVSKLNDVTWVGLLNPDAFPIVDWLARLLEAAHQHSEYHCFASRMMLDENPGRLDGTGDVYHVSGQVWRRHHRKRVECEDLRVDEVFSPCAAAALYRKKAFVDVGGFDEGYFSYLEDVDIGFRLRLAGYRCLYVPDAIVRHVGSATTGGPHSDFAVYHGHRNLVWTYFKNMPWSLCWLYFPQHLLLNIVSLLWFSLRGQARVIWKAKWDALKGLPRIVKERRRIQKNRRVGACELRRMMARGLLTPYLRWKR